MQSSQLQSQLQSPFSSSSSHGMMRINSNSNINNSNNYGNNHSNNYSNSYSNNHSSNSSSMTTGIGISIGKHQSPLDEETTKRRLELLEKRIMAPPQHQCTPQSTPHVNNISIKNSLSHELSPLMEVTDNQEQHQYQHQHQPQQQHQEHYQHQNHSGSHHSFTFHNVTSANIGTTTRTRSSSTPTPTPTQTSTLNTGNNNQLPTIQTLCASPHLKEVNRCTELHIANVSRKMQMGVAVSGSISVPASGSMSASGSISASGSASIPASVPSSVCNSNLSSSLPLYSRTHSNSSSRSMNMNMHMHNNMNMNTNTNTSMNTNTNSVSSSQTLITSHGYAKHQLHPHQNQNQNHYHNSGNSHQNNHHNHQNHHSRNGPLVKLVESPSARRSILNSSTSTSAATSATTSTPRNNAISSFTSSTTANSNVNTSNSSNSFNNTFSSARTNGNFNIGTTNGQTINGTITSSGRKRKASRPMKIPKPSLSDNNKNNHINNNNNHNLNNSPLITVSANNNKTNNIADAGTNKINDKNNLSHRNKRKRENDEEQQQPQQQLQPMQAQDNRHSMQNQRPTTITPIGPMSSSISPCSPSPSCIPITNGFNGNQQQEQPPLQYQQQQQHQVKKSKMQITNYFTKKQSPNAKKVSSTSKSSQYSQKPQHQLQQHQQPQQQQSELQSQSQNHESRAYHNHNSHHHQQLLALQTQSNNTMDTYIQDNKQKDTVISELKNQIITLNSQINDKSAQLKAVSNNQTIIHSQLKATLTQREEEHKKAKAKYVKHTGKLMDMVEYMIRKESRREQNVKKQKIASDSARLGRWVYNRVGMRMENGWKDGDAVKEIIAKKAGLKWKREVVERKLKDGLKKFKISKIGGSDSGIDGDQDDYAFEKQEFEYSISVQLEKLEKEEQELEVEEDAIRVEKAAHMRELRRVANEDASRFKARPKLNDRYVPLCQLGKGGFSEVWRAYDLVELREVAVKIHQLDPRWSAAKIENFTRHVSREYEIHRDAKYHPRIVSLYDVFEIDADTFATVLECCNGTDLDTLLQEKKRLPEQHAKAILLQILSGMKYLSTPSEGNKRKGIIHYDLKPGNILFDELGDAKITDFGLSKIMNSPDPSDSMELTSQGSGTYWYLPPECFVTSTSVKITNRVDVWSIGVIFFQMLYGKRPFGDGKSQEIVLKTNIMLNAREVQFPNLPTVSEDAKNFIRQCLAYEQTLRPNIAELCKNPYVTGKK